MVERCSAHTHEIMKIKVVGAQCSVKDDQGEGDTLGRTGLTLVPHSFGLYGKRVLSRVTQKQWAWSDREQIVSIEHDV
jgi:hypothetical protein